MSVEPCPSCGQIDAVQKVSAIVEGAQTRFRDKATTSGVTVTSSGHLGAASAGTSIYGEADVAPFVLDQRVEQAVIHHSVHGGV